MTAQVPGQRRPDRRLAVAQVVTRFQAGAGGVALRGAAALDPQRYAVTIVAGSGDRLLGEARDLGLEVVLLPELVAPLRPRQDWAALRALTGLMAGRRFDVVHTHSAKAGALGRLAAVRVGTPRIVHTLHGFPFHDCQPAVQRAVYVAAERRLGRVTDVFLAVGTGVAVEAVRRGIARPEQVRTIAPAISPGVVPVDPSSRREARRALQLPEDVPVVGSVGRLDFQKAPEHLVRALAAMTRSDVVVVWVGDGPHRDRTEREIARLGLQDRFRLLGERSDVARLLPAFDVFAMASRYEGLPCAVVEAQACGLPVVATAVNAVPDVVSPGRTGLLVPPGRPLLLAAAVQHLLDRPDVAGRLARAGQEQLGSRFDADELGAVLRECYGQPAQREPGLARPVLRAGQP